MSVSPQPPLTDSASKPNAPWAERWARLRRPLVAVAGVGAVLSGLAGWWNTYMTVRNVATSSSQSSSTASAASAPAAALSVVVLPFANQTGDPQKAYIADGLTSSLTSDLARIQDAYIVPAATAFAYRDKGLTVQQLGQTLGVGYVLGGSVVSGGQKLRITAQLSDAHSGAQIWSRSFDGELADLLGLQDQVTTEIAGSTGSAMVLSAARQSEKRRGNPTAADLRLRARALSFQPQSAEKFEREQALLRQALKLEPGDSSTELELATLLWVQARNFERDAADKTKQKKLFDEARKLAARASAEEPDNLRACRLMGNFALEDGELEVARGIFERCLAVDPKARALLGDLASTWMYDGTEGARKAIALFRKAAEIEGSHPHEATQMNLGEALFVAGDSAAALEPLQLTLRLNPEFGEAEFYLALAYADLGDLEHMKAHTAAIAGWIETIKREKRDVGDFASFKGFEKYNSVKTPGYQTYRDTRLLPLWRKAGLPP